MKIGDYEIISRYLLESLYYSIEKDLYILFYSIFKGDFIYFNGGGYIRFILMCFRQKKCYGKLLCNNRENSLYIASVVFVFSIYNFWIS